MNQNELNYYELIEFLRAVHEHLLDMEGESLVIPKKHQPYVKEIIHDCIGEIIMMLCCIDTLVNPELFDDLNEPEQERETNES